MSMLLKSLKIYRGAEYSYQPQATEKLKGEVEFYSSGGDKIAIRLTEDAAKKILDICAEGLVDASKKVALDLTAEILTQVNQLTGPEGEHLLS